MTLRATAMFVARLPNDVLDIQFPAFASIKLADARRDFGTQ